MSAPIYHNAEVIENLLRGKTLTLFGYVHYAGTPHAEMCTIVRGFTEQDTSCQIIGHGVVYPRLTNPQGVRPLDIAAYFGLGDAELQEANWHVWPLALPAQTFNPPPGHKVQTIPLTIEMTRGQDLTE